MLTRKIKKLPSLVLTKIFFVNQISSPASRYFLIKMLQIILNLIHLEKQVHSNHNVNDPYLQNHFFLFFSYFYLFVFNLTHKNIQPSTKLHQVAPPPAAATLHLSLFEYLKIYIHKFEKYLVDSDEIRLMDQVKTQKRPVEICLVNLRSLIPYWQMTTQNGRLKMAAYCIDLYRTVRVVRFLFMFYILN